MEEIVTGDAVVLDLPCARFPTRVLARLVDLLVQAGLMGVILIAMVASAAHLDSASAAATGITAGVLVIVGYPVIFETLSRGKTLGKLALGLRVVSDDGGPVRFRQALVRGLAGAVECWGLFGVPALITSMLSARGKRLGDVFAGTFVLRERVPRQAPLYLPPLGPRVSGTASGPPGYAYTASGYTASGGPRPAVPVPGVSPAGGHVTNTAYPLDPALSAWARSLDLSALPDALAASAASYLSRYWELDRTARDRLAHRLATDIAARVSPPPPPGLLPVPYLGIVLAERRDREYARLTRPAAPAPVQHTQPAPSTSPAQDQAPAQDTLRPAQETGSAQDTVPAPPGGFTPPA